MLCKLSRRVCVLPGHACFTKWCCSAPSTSDVCLKHSLLDLRAAWPTHETASAKMTLDGSGCLFNAKMTLDGLECSCLSSTFGSQTRFFQNFRYSDLRQRDACKTMFWCMPSSINLSRRRCLNIILIFTKWRFSAPSTSDVCLKHCLLDFRAAWPTHVHSSIFSFIKHLWFTNSLLIDFIDVCMWDHVLMYA